MHINWGKGWGKGREKFMRVWGKVDDLKFSTLRVSYPQSYPLGFQPVLQGSFRQSTGSTTTITLINIY